MHIEKTALPLAIGVESNGTCYDTGDDVDRDSEQVGESYMESDLQLGVSMIPTMNS